MALARFARRKIELLIPELERSTQTPKPFVWKLLGNLISSRVKRLSNDQNVMPLSPGTRLGRYEIRSLIGEGGMGEVYLAYDRQLERTVALKILNESFAADYERMRRF